MRGIGPEDGRRIFVSIFQKFVGKLSSESHTLLWVNIADRRVCVSVASTTNDCSAIWERKIGVGENAE